MEVVEHAIRLADGRIIEALEQGNTHGRPVIYLHSTPGSARERNGFDELYQQHNIRLLSVNRPGIGASTASNDWNALTFANDLLQLMDHLAIDKAAIIGFSAGGLYGCAFAHQHPERVERLALLASVGPFDVPHLDTKRSDATKAFHKAAKENPSALFEQLSAVTTPEALLAMVDSLICPEDRALFARPDIRTQMLPAYADVLAQGLDKVIKEIAIINTPWGFAPEEITVKTQIWHGTADINIPIECSEYLAEKIPSATATYIEGAGHYFSFAQWPELLKAIMAD